VQEFSDALALTDTLSPMRQLAIMTAFRRNYASFPSVKDAFIAAVEHEVGEEDERQDVWAEEPRAVSDPRWWVRNGPPRINWPGVIGLSTAAASAGFMFGWVYTLSRWLGVGT
jgi:hypothetical protein